MSYFLSPISTMQFEDANGVPYSGAKLFTYAAGTTTKQATYQTSTGSANTNPIVLDANGRPPYGIWTPAGNTYHYFLAASTDTDPPAGAALYEVDNVTSINDTTATGAGSGQWIDSGLTPTYISTTSFSVPGDKLEIFTVGRKVKLTITAGDAYQIVASATYGSSITTVVLVSSATPIDSGISAVYYGIISSDYSNILTSQPDIRTPRYLVASTSNNTDYTLTELSTKPSYKTLRYEDGMLIDVYIPTGGLNTGAVTLNINSLGAYPLVDGAGNALTAGLLQPGYTIRASYYLNQNKFYLQETVSPALIFGAVSRGARHAINYAPVDTSGLTALGGSTGSATVTTTAISATEPLVVNAASVVYNGSMLDEVGYSSSNLTWTGLSTNGTMYLYVDITEKTRALTTGSTTLAPVYQFAGTPSVTSGQATYNYSNNRMYVGNGATAPQARRVFVGQVTVSGNVTTAITWYQVNGVYESKQTYNGTADLTFAHQLGVSPRNIQVFMNCTTNDGTYTAGDSIIVTPFAEAGSTGAADFGFAIKKDSTNVTLYIGINGITLIEPNNTQLTPANGSWDIGIIAKTF